MQASHLVDFQPTRRAPFRQRHNLQNSNQYPDEPPTALLLKDEYTDMNKSRQQNNALSTLVENQHEQSLQVGHVISATVKQRDKRYQSQTTTAAMSVQG